MKKATISKLAERYLNGTASEAEKRLVQQLLDDLAQNPAGELTPEEEKLKEALLLKGIHRRIHKGKLVFMPIRKAVAVAAILILAAGTWFLIKRSGSKQDKAVAKRVQDIPAPQNNRATITLADGRKIYLDSIHNGAVAAEGGVEVVKNGDGQIAYRLADGGEGAELLYNTLFNPRGSKVIDVNLSDGTHVWLNSGSSLTFPVAFTGKGRNVTIDGEAYFEVAHDASKPFIVRKGEMQVQVLGTHFDVNAYDDEADIKVTLLQGSVRVSNPKSKIRNPESEVLLKPGEQALINQSTNQPINIIHPDLDQVMAWKNGMFLLDNTDLPAIMRQISRWYDVDVVYQSKASDEKFVGGMSKNLPLTKVLEMLRSNGIQTELNGKVLKVK